MSAKDGRQIKTRGFTRNSKRQYTKNVKYKTSSNNIWHKQ